ncbi:class I SAM-dependent methyltransferase [Clostridium weizhouense]|uniref:Class I SAM-dependent methyltransferase n=1 Tax=Clostridium weizhouense TaxID=2859781 RepID=A0ABS7ASM7_9CLOT|nr:class I SAM-dependent methyltransferase [Clostridium weizhouense]MBW6410656.1 class I SAM-dependent methyltransferase [Clostridium weizhouense]
MNFDDEAKNWDTERRINRAKVIANKISNSININKNFSAMEFGCGTGLISFNLYNKFKEITLIDSSKGMIDILNYKINKYKVNNMTAKNLDIFDENSLNMKYDVIYSSMALHHIYNTEKIIKKFYELLNENGYLCIVDLDKDDGSFHKEDPNFNGHNGFDQEELKGVFSSAGFNDVESSTFFNGIKVIDGKKNKYSLFLMRARKVEN